MITFLLVALLAGSLYGPLFIMILGSSRMWGFNNMVLIFSFTGFRFGHVCPYYIQVCVGFGRVCTPVW